MASVALHTALLWSMLEAFASAENTVSEPQGEQPLASVALAMYVALAIAVFGGLLLGLGYFLQTRMDRERSSKLMLIVATSGAVILGSVLIYALFFRKNDVMTGALLFLLAVMFFGGLLFYVAAMLHNLRHGVAQREVKEEFFSSEEEQSSLQPRMQDEGDAKFAADTNALKP